MKQYIDKAAVVAEIKKIYNEDYKFLPSDIVENIQDFKDDILINIDTLEVKEVEEETESIWHDANQQPTMYRKYLVRYSDDRVSGSWEKHDDGFIPWKDVVKEHGFTHWCYVEDLIKL